MNYETSLRQNNGIMDAEIEIMKIFFDVIKILLYYRVWHNNEISLDHMHVKISDEYALESCFILS